MLSTIYVPIDYAGNGVDVDFDFPWRILAKVDLIVLQIDDATEVVTTLVLDTDYTIPDGDVDAAAGGTITLTGGALASGQTLYLIRRTTRTQLVNWAAGGSFDTAVLMKALDRLTMMIQSLDEDFRKTLHFRQASPTVDMIVPEPENGFFLGWVNNLLANVEIDTDMFLGDAEAPALNAGSFAVTFDTALANTNYQILSIAPNWLTSWYYENKTVNGFDVVFSNPAPASAEFTWRVRVI